MFSDTSIQPRRAYQAQTVSTRLRYASNKSEKIPSPLKLKKKLSELIDKNVIWSYWFNHECCSGVMLSTKVWTEQLVRSRLANKIERMLRLFCNGLLSSPSLDLLLIVISRGLSITHRVLPTKSYHLSSRILFFSHGFELSPTSW